MIHAPPLKIEACEHRRLAVRAWIHYPSTWCGRQPRQSDRQGATALLQLALDIGSGLRSPDAFISAG